ncbi:MAG: hypothetical protein ABWZ76_04490 [Acidimicrobiales bacterium]
MRLEDGDHRVEGLRRANTDLTWAVIAFVPPEPGLTPSVKG